MPSANGFEAGRAARRPIPRGLLIFCLALMGPGLGINAVLIALAVPAMAPFGTPGLVVAGLLGSLFGIFPALWLARRIDDGLRDD